ncbi:MAG: T9SS type A sorting domain-containing protein [Flavobacteriales bacterium]
MKILYKLFFTLLFIGSFSNTNAQTTPCNLTGGSVYVGYTAPPIMMNATVNGMSQYSYSWTNGASANQNQFYSGWCVTITDLMTGCDTTICESCIPTGGVGPCTMIYDPVCGCDGTIYSNDCIAMQNGIFTFTSAIGPNGQLLPCTGGSPLPCSVDILASGATTFCEGDSVQLQPTTFNVNGAYLWYTGNTNHEIWVSTTGDYILSYTNDTGCVATDTMYVEVIPEPTLVAYTAPNPPTLCLGDSLVIELTQGLMNYYWNTANPLHQDQDRIVVFPTEDFIYVVEVLDSNGCGARLEIEVFVDSCATGFYSEMFSKISIYPNPTKDILNVDLPENEVFSVSMFTIEGKLISREINVMNSISISSADIAKGQYILQIENNKGTFNQKVIFE